MPQQFAYFPLGGGLDLITPAIAQKPGSAIGALNYEPAANGYRRVEGYERFDGRQSPTDAPYYELDFTAAVASFAPHDQVFGATSGASATVLATSVVTSGSFSSGDAAGYLGLGAIVGNFIDGEDLLAAPAGALFSFTLEDDITQLTLEDDSALDTEASGSGGGFVVLDLEDDSGFLLETGTGSIDLEGGGSALAIADGTQQLLVAPDDATARAWQAAATANARSLILTVPGSGPVRGVWEFRNAVYAFRDNIGATAGVMWKSSTAGWVQVALGYTIAFTSGGTYAVQEGDVITGASSGKTATVMRIVTLSGSWSAGTAAGYFVVASASGAFTPGENVDVPGHANSATLSADKVAITLPAGGRYQFVTHNFYGASQLTRMYGVNGIGKAFEFDGATFTPITSGMAVDTPTRVIEHKNHLFLAFPGGAFQNSSIDAPLDWSAVTGAALYGMGDEITDFISNNAGVLTILAANKVASLYGTSTADFQLVTLSDESGALPWTAERIGEPIYVDHVGVRSLSATQAYGDFNIATISERVRPLIQDYARTGINPVAAFKVRTKNHYRLIYDNQAGLCFRFGKKVPEVLPFNWGRAVTCIGSFETITGERIFFGSDNGFVYEADKGYSFDGDPIPYSLRLPFNHEGAPQTLKRWHKVTAECQAIPQATISIAADFDYGDPFEAGASPREAVSQVFTVTGGGGIWDISNWNQFFWSGATEGLMEAHLDGVGRNMSLLIAGSTSDEPPHLLQGLTLFFTVRGLQR